jgi:hypothetical protein
LSSLLSEWPPLDYGGTEQVCQLVVLAGVGWIRPVSTTVADTLLT